MIRLPSPEQCTLMNNALSAITGFLLSQPNGIPTLRRIRTLCTEGYGRQSLLPDALYHGLRNGNQASPLLLSVVADGTIIQPVLNLKIDRYDEKQIAAAHCILAEWLTDTVGNEDLGLAVAEPGCLPWWDVIHNNNTICTAGRILKAAGFIQDGTDWLWPEPPYTVTIKLDIPGNSKWLEIQTNSPYSIRSVFQDIQDHCRKCKSLPEILEFSVTWKEKACVISENRKAVSTEDKDLWTIANDILSKAGFTHINSIWRSHTLKNDNKEDIPS